MAKKMAAYPDFFNEPRNIMLSFCVDGVNPWKKKRFASFLVLVFSVLHLPPDIRMKSR
jgi:hypothetical protein